MYFWNRRQGGRDIFDDNGNDLEKIAADMKKKDILVDDELADRKRAARASLVIMC